MSNLFSGKIRKTNMNLSSTESAQRLVKVKKGNLRDFVKLCNMFMPILHSNRCTLIPLANQTRRESKDLISYLCSHATHLRDKFDLRQLMVEFRRLFADF